MESYKCDRCGTETSKTRTGTGKDGNAWIGYICQNPACVSDKVGPNGKPYPYMFYINKNYWAKMKANTLEETQMNARSRSTHEATVDQARQIFGGTIVNDDLKSIAQSLRRLADRFAPIKKERADLSGDPLEQIDVTENYE